MRRILAIAMVGALMCSTALPLWASACETMKATPMCHRMAAEHHCEMEQQDDSTSQGTDPVMSSRPGYCPMHCCMQSSAGTATAVANAPGTIALPAVRNRVSISNPTFISSGFSSHTDRGPPLA